MAQKGKSKDSKNRNLAKKINDNRVAIMIGLKVGEWLVRLLTDSIADEYEIDTDDLSDDENAA